VRDLLIRTAVALPVVLLLPSVTPWASRLRFVLCPLLVALALAPHLDGWRAWVVVAIALLAAPLVGRGAHPWQIGAVVLLAWIAGTLVADAGGAVDAVGAVLGSGDLAVIALGGLGAVFLGGALVGLLLRSFALAAGQQPDRSGLANAGRTIGWLERALVFGLLVAGAPAGAAVVVALKTAARFPHFEDERFAEYYLVGTLLSLGIAAAAGVAVRAALGLELVP
jgi:hypothetical protein